MLLDIQEPGQPEREERDAIGIDLGTTNSLVSYSINGKAYIIGDILPSIVCYSKEGIIVGKKVQDSVCLSSVKRFMGKGIDDFDRSSLLAQYVQPNISNPQAISFCFNSTNTTPIEVSAEILKTLKLRAEEHLQKPITRAVITVPAYFDEEARTATRHAANLAGLEVLRLINEPTAASVAYGLDRQAEGIYVVYDLGGGTFDVSVLNIQKGVIQVLATGGDTNLGGDDIDYLVARWIEANGSYHNLTREALYEYARKAKEELSLSLQSRSSAMTIAEFNEVITPLINKTLNITKATLRDADIDKSEINGIILVGGSTRIPLIKDELQKHFSMPCLGDINPDHVVALGAAIQAESLARGFGNLLIDVTPLSLGLEVMGGLNEKIIERNTPLPVSVTKEFTTYQDGQTGISFHILQGERELVADCRSLAKFELSNIPPMKAGTARVAVSFYIDVDGLLTVTAAEAVTGQKQIVDIRPTYGLDEDTIERMLIESMQHAQADISMRLLQESRVKADQLIILASNALAEDPELVSKRELTAINKQITNLQNAVKTDNRNKIEETLASLETLIRDFGDRKIQKYVKLALQGKNIESL